MSRFQAEGVIFDADGVLWDTRLVKAISTQRAMWAAGYSDFRWDGVGRTKDAILTHLVTVDYPAHEEAVEHLYAARMRYALDLLLERQISGGLVMQPWAYKIFVISQASNFPYAIYSGLPQEVLEAFTVHPEERAFMFGRESLTEPDKPGTGPLLRAAASLPVTDPKRILVVDDEYERGIVPAELAGFQAMLWMGDEWSEAEVKQRLQIGKYARD